MPEISASDEDMVPTRGMVWTGNSRGLTGRGVWDGTEFR